MKIPDDADPETVERIRNYANGHPRADAVQVLAQLLVDPDVYKPVAEAAVAGNLSKSATEPDKSGGDDLPNDLDNESETQDGDGATDGPDAESGTTYTDKDFNLGICTHGADDDGDWADADFTAPETDVWPPAWEDRDFWMAHQEKKPFAPWSDADHPAADDDADARFSWSIADNWADKDTVDRWVRMDPRLDGHVALLDRDDGDAYTDDPDPFAFVDGDDVRDPDTGRVHPGFVALLERLGATYADVSTSGSGVHALYRGALPDGYGQAVFQIDDEPWGANDSPPTVEIYDGKHVCVVTGEHVPGTPMDVNPWDDDALAAILDEHAPDQAAADASHDTDHERPEMDAYEPAATGSGETTDDIRDVYAAVDRLGARDLPLRTRQVGEDATGWEKWDPSTYRASSGGESLHSPDGQVFHDFKTGQSFGLLSLFAAEQGILSNPWDRLAGADFWDAVDAARDAGASIPEYDAGDDVEPVAALPDTDALQGAVSGWDWRHAADEPQRDLSIDAARERTTDAIADAYGRRDQVLVEALPTMGKSYGAVAAAADTGTDVTILTGRGRKEQYAQFRDWADEHGLAHYTLPSFTHDCPTAAGEHGDDWAERVRDWYRRGATPQEIHKAAEYVLGRPLPCQEHDGQACSYASKWDFDPDDYDVLIGHYSHAHKQKVTSGRRVVFDEFPGSAYETQLTFELAGAVSYFLETTDAVPFDDYTDLIENRDDDQRRSDALAWFQDQDLEPDETQVFDDASAHAAAPLAVFTILAGDDLGNGWERADLDDHGTGAFDRANGKVHILQPPALDYASGIVALDGTPTERMWELALGTRLNHRPILSDAERREYVRGVLNLNLVRTTDAVKPYTPQASKIDERVALEQDAALLEAIRDAHGQRPSLITTSRAEHYYDQQGVLDLVDDTQHYGNVLGSNQFKETRLGAVIGSNFYGGGFVKKWGAFAGDVVEPRWETDDDGVQRIAYDGFGQDVLTHMREHDTLQAAMRFGRDGNGAVVYVHTDTLPDWVPLAGEGRVVNTWSDGMRQVVEAGKDLNSWRTTEIADHPDVEISQRQVFDHLKTLQERGYLDAETEGRGYRWTDDGLHRVNDHGDVELDPVDLDDLDDAEVAEVARTTTYTWQFRKPRPDDVAGGPGDGQPAVTDGGVDADAPERDGPPPG